MVKSPTVTTQAAKFARAPKSKREDRYFDYKDFKTLTRFTNPYGQVDSRRRSGLNAREQRRLARAIKRARHLALLPFSNR